MGSNNPDYLTAPKDNRWVSYILKHISSENSQLEVFEIGCGSGNRLASIKKEIEALGIGVHATGCDYSESALSVAQKKGIDIVHGGLEEIACTGKADVVILSHVFEHFPDLAMAIKGLSNIAHDDSIIYIEVPGVNDLENKREYLYNYQLYSVLAHTYNFSLKTLSMVLKTGGFSLVEGDEYVHAIFKKNIEGQQMKIESENAYQETISAIERAYVNQISLERKRNRYIIKYARNLAKAILGRSCD